MPADLGRSYKASNGEVFTGIPGGLERIWWTFGAESRITSTEKPVRQCQPNLDMAFKQGWDAMDERLEAPKR